MNTGDALGGATFWATTAEVRFPLPFVPEDLGMSGAVFADAGSLLGAGASAQSLPAGCDAGNGQALPCRQLGHPRVGRRQLMWNSPLGPLRLDLAKALTKETYDDEQIFRFGAATKF